MKKVAILLISIGFAQSSAADDCSFWDIGDRLSDSVTPATRSAFGLLDQALENPDLMNSPNFRARLAQKMEDAGRDGKRYLAPPHETGPLPSKDVMGSWLDDAKSIVVCD